ncbi:hypothetical protein A5866_001665 [Enterococcus sp. 12C11_DIV0727]|uniref:Uncharacterized protein n=2 Tax=Candidatus Enterococcus lemimoniae TaxID=1834167 RepID=A0ABZ2T5F0_9ENTE|nr:hypothetical protein A5866_000360 [Enterococcus sp. 12C11_DIV0727]
MTIYFKENLNTLVNAYLIYPLIRELSIQSRMIKKMKNTKSYIEVVQLLNLIRKGKEAKQYNDATADLKDEYYW